jgi:hypothetical protein
MMTDFLHTVRRERHVHQLISLGLLLVLCWGCAMQHAPAPDPALDAVRQALQNEYQDPGATSKTLETNLHKVRDKQIINVLLDYLEDRRHRQGFYSNNVGQVVFYLEEITGVKSHIQTTFFGPGYLDPQDWDRDIAQWREWWKANRDFVVWDEQSGKLKVIRP